jgi:hypothetical protein
VIPVPVPEQVVPVPTFGNGRAPAIDGPDTIDLSLPPAQSFLPAAGGATDAVPDSPPDARALSGPSAPAGNAPEASPPGFNTPAPEPAPDPAALIPPPGWRSGSAPSPPGAPAPALSPPQFGYPAELHPDDLGRIASTAMPGLAALAAMTILGGVIGFRQARAGYLLRAAGAGRFLR